MVRYISGDMTIRVKDYRAPFVIRISSTGQILKLLPSTSLGQMWLIKENACGDKKNEILDAKLTSAVNLGGAYSNQLSKA